MATAESARDRPALRLLSWAAVAAPLLLLLWHSWFGPDIWYHLYLGGRVAEARSAQPPDNLVLRQPGFLNLYWLFQLLVRGAWSLGGVPAVSALMAAAWAGALACWLRTAGLYRAGPGAAAFAFATVFVCSVRFEARPEAFSYLFLALQVHWLCAWRMDAPPRRWELARYTLVQVAWSNMHGYFAFGPLLVALRLAAGLPDALAPGRARRPPGWSALGRLLALALLGSLVSPFGWRNWAAVAVLWNFLGAMHRDIQEFLPVLTGPMLGLWTTRVLVAYGLVLAAAALRVLLTAPRRNLFALLLAAVGLALGPQAFRNVPLAVFLTAPLVGAAWPRRPARFERPGRLAAIALGAAWSAAIVSGAYYRLVGSPDEFGARLRPGAYPEGFAGYLRVHGFGGVLFDRASDGGYLEFQFPRLRLFGDSRFTDVPLVREYFRATVEPAVFREIRRRYGVDGALLAVDESPDLIAALLREPGWRLAYADPHRAFLVDAATPAGAAAALAEPRFYDGGDLARPEARRDAVRWIGLLARAGDRSDLIRALEQLGRAPRVPYAVVEAALGYGLRGPDAGVIAAARALRPRMEAAPTDAATVDWLLDRAPSD